MRLFSLSFFLFSFVLVHDLFLPVREESAGLFFFSPNPEKPKKKKTKTKRKNGTSSILSTPDDDIKDTTENTSSSLVRRHACTKTDCRIDGISHHVEKYSIVLFTFESIYTQTNTDRQADR